MSEESETLQCIHCKEEKIEEKRERERSGEKILEKRGERRKPPKDKRGKESVERIGNKREWRWEKEERNKKTR